MSPGSWGWDPDVPLVGKSCCPLKGSASPVMGDLVSDFHEKERLDWT